MKFEEKIKRIEEIADKLDNNETPLEELVKLFEEGNKLVEECRDYLNETEQKIKEILPEKD